jgi:hypothetical protein
VQWLYEQRLVLALGLLASIPILTSTVRALAGGWTPVNDSAVVALRSFDVFTTHTPLLGQYSNVSQIANGTIYSPGPLLFWLLAVPARVLGDRALPLTIALVNTASVVGVVALARRRGGDVFMLATAGAIPLMCLSVPQETLHAIVNLSSALLPFTLFLFLAWSVGCGDYRLVPLTVLVMSFVVQSHLTLAGPTLMTTLVALGGLSWRLRRGRATPAIRTASAPWLFAGFAVAIVCWLLPLLDQALHQPGNLARLVQTATSAQRTLTLSEGWHALVGAIGIWPWWLRASPTALGRVHDVATGPSAVSAISCVFILIALAVVAARGRRVRSDLRLGAGLAVVLSMTIVVGTAATPAKLGYDILTGLLWTSPVGMFVWLMLGWSLAVVARVYLVPRGLSPRVRTTPVLLAGLAAVTVIGGISGAKLRGSDSNARWYQPVRTIVTQVAARLPHTGVTLVDIRGDYNTFTVQTALIWELRERGYRVVAFNGYLDLVRKLGAYYDACRTLPDRTLLVSDDGSPLPPGSLVLATSPVPSSSGGVGSALGRSTQIMRVALGGPPATLLTTCTQ